MSSLLYFHMRKMLAHQSHRCEWTRIIALPQCQSTTREGKSFIDLLKSIGRRFCRRRAKSRDIDDIYFKYVLKLDFRLDTYAFFVRSKNMENLWKTPCYTETHYLHKHSWSVSGFCWNVLHGLFIQTMNHHWSKNNSLFNWGPKHNKPWCMCINRHRKYQLHAADFQWFYS